MNPRHWFGDYQTSSGYALQTTPKKWIYKPVWTEPNDQVRFGHVEYVEHPSSLGVFDARARILPMRKIDIRKLPRIENQPERPDSK